MVSSVKLEVERWYGDQFIAWYNQRQGTSYAFKDHALPPDADLIYADGPANMFVEVTGAYYDQDAARFEGMNADRRTDAPQGWNSLKDDGCLVAVDEALQVFIDQRLAEKSKKVYRHPPVLIIFHVSRLLGSASLSRILNRVEVPRTHPFSAIYFLMELPDGDPNGPVWIRPLMEA